MFVYLSKRMLTQVLALTLVGFSNMMRTGQLLCRISERCVTCFRKRRHMVRWWWVHITLSIDIVFSLFFEKSRERHSGVVKLSTDAIANSLKTAVAPTHD